MSELYLDASITKLVIDEADSDALTARVAGSSLVSSRVAVVEVMKAVARANPQRRELAVAGRSVGFAVEGA